jgi:hypothetical protein
MQWAVPLSSVASPAPPRVVAMFYGFAFVIAIASLWFLYCLQSYARLTSIDPEL